MAALVSGVQTLPPIPSLLHQVLPRHRPERRGACIGAAREPWNCCCMLLVVLMAASRKWTSLMLAPALVLALVAGVSCAGSVSSSENLRRGRTTRRSLADVLPNGSSSMAKWNVQWEMVGAVDDPEVVVATVHSAIRNSTGARSPDGEPCGTGNPVDDCWRCDPEWQRHRKKLADCGMGFGKDAIGGLHGRFYRVTDPTDDDPLNPSPGTLRHAAIQDEPLWIVFVGDMVITLKQELVMNSYKTIDGRGANVHVAGGGCITLEYVTNIIIHGVHIHDCKSTGNAMVRSSPSHYMWRSHSDGDAVSIFASSHIWVDHCSLSNSADGLVDAIMGSTAITISNNYFTNHNEVMLLGHSDDHIPDKHMQVTIAFNHFGEGLIQRMPRCRHGYFHVVNNDYTHWEMYAIGGSAEPTINSQGNRYLAPSNPYAKEVTKRIDANSSEWKKWNWRSEGDLFLNGAYFTPSGAGAASGYSGDSRHAAKSASMVGACTAGAGVLACRRGHPC